MSPPPSPLDRVFGAIVPRAVGAIDMDEVIGTVDVDHLVSEVDVDGLIQRVDVNGIVQRVDIDGLMTRVDVDALLQRVDIEALLARIDLEVLLGRIDLNTLIGRLDMNALMAQVDTNTLIQSVDINALMQQVDVDTLMGRIDLDALLARVDVEAMMKRAKIDQIVSNASRGVFARLLDTVRRQVVGLDLLLVRGVTRVFRRPREAVSVATGSVTGRVAGGISRLVAYLIDAGFISVSYGVSAALVVFMIQLFSGTNVSAADHPTISIIGYVVFGFFYYWLGLAITGRSIGKGLVGLRVVAKNGDPITPGRAAVRTIVYPFSFILGLGLLPIVVGKQRRALHDWAAGDKVLYDWGDRPAEMPAPLTSWVRHRAEDDRYASAAAGVAPAESAATPAPEVVIDLATPVIAAPVDPATNGSSNGSRNGSSTAAPTTPATGPDSTTP